MGLILATHQRWSSPIGKSQSIVNSVGPPGASVFCGTNIFTARTARSLIISVAHRCTGACCNSRWCFSPFVATFSRRHGPISTPIQPSRLSPLEFVETLGDLYLSAHAGSAAVRIADQRLRFQLSRQLGLPPNASNYGSRQRRRQVTLLERTGVCEHARRAPT